MLFYNMTNSHQILYIGDTNLCQLMVKFQKVITQTFENEDKTLYKREHNENSYKIHDL